MLPKILAWSALVLTLLFAGVSLAGVFGGAALGGLGPTLILVGCALAGVAALLATVVLILGSFQS
mgnify:CR=1 FL=1